MDMHNRMLRVKAERLNRGWTQTELAYFARMSSADVSRIVSGRMIPYPAHAQRLARVLDLAPSDMLEEVELPLSSPEETKCSS